MIKKTVKYIDFDGNEREEAFYFHLSQLELGEMELSAKGGLKKYIEMLVDTDDQSEIFRIFKELLLKSVGVKSSDGRRFIKNEEIRNDFAQTEAFSALFLELGTNADVAAAFINGLASEPKKKQ